MELVIVRTYLPDGTNGDIFLNGKRVCYSIELPWKENKAQVSCIPEGKYALTKRYSARFGHHLLVRNVPGRKWILLHPANNAHQELKGCIAPVSFLTGQGKGGQSKKALTALLKMIYPVSDRNNPVFLILQSKVYEHSNQKNA
jgi:Family of unknown function (DUF5675)